MDSDNISPDSLNDIVLALNERQVPIFRPDWQPYTLWERIEIYASDKAKYQLKSAASEIETKPKFKLSKDQLTAWIKLQVWLKSDYPYFVLKGYAGTGKTYLLNMLVDLPYNFKFTAPTNKATKVISSMLNVEASTIYSLLGLRMVAHEDGLHLTYPKNLPQIAKGTIIVIDESSMLGRKLTKFVLKVCKKLKVRILFVGDPMQLNPIGEITSPTWKVTDKKEYRALLREVVRFDNQLLKLSEAIRNNIKNKVYKSPIVDDHDDKQGVYVLSENRFEKSISQLKLEDFTNTKIISWRNKTVNYYNNLIRENFDFQNEYEVGEPLLLAEPIEKDGKIIGHIDEEGVIKTLFKTSIKVDDIEIPVWSIAFKTDVKIHYLHVPMRDDEQLDELLAEKAARARNEKNWNKRRVLWAEFWETKRKFHHVRYGYSLTAHRIQGTTLHSAFINQEDIMANKNKKEAMRCLYVGCTRPTTKLFTF